MTPEGEFRDPSPRRGGIDRALGKVGGVALLVALAAGGLLLASLAVLFFSLLLPVVVGAGLVAFVSLWWRMRRLHRAGSAPGQGAGSASGQGAGSAPGQGGGGAPGQGGGAVRFVILRR